jgi:hypothetical protein
MVLLLQLLDLLHQLGNGFLVVIAGTGTGVLRPTGGWRQQQGK